MCIRDSCNGFQALVKLGLVPYGKIMEPDEFRPTLTFNTIGRHQSKLVKTRIACNQSPWMKYMNVGDIHTVAISHGEGRFIAKDNVIQTLIDNGQIATQYVNFEGKPTSDIHFNPNNSVYAIEGITSPDGLSLIHIFLIIEDTRKEKITRLIENHITRYII